jgi:hypothetical protein
MGTLEPEASAMTYALDGHLFVELCCKHEQFESAFY